MDVQKLVLLDVFDGFVLQVAEGVARVSLVDFLQHQRSDASGSIRELTPITSCEQQQHQIRDDTICIILITAKGTQPTTTTTRYVCTPCAKRHPHTPYIIPHTHAATDLHAFLGGGGGDLCSLVEERAHRLLQERLVRDLHGHHVTRAAQHLLRRLELTVGRHTEQTHIHIQITCAKQQLIN